MSMDLIRHSSKGVESMVVKKKLGKNKKKNCYIWLCCEPTILKSLYRFGSALHLPRHVL